MLRTIVVVGDDHSHSDATRAEYAEWRIRILDRAANGARSTMARLDAHELSYRTGVPCLARAFSSPDDKTFRAAVEMVRIHVEEHGAGAVRELEQLALASRDPYDRVNYARAASALATADPERLRRMQLDSLRARYGVPHQKAPAPTPTRRRRA